MKTERVYRYRYNLIKFDSISALSYVYKFKLNAIVISLIDII